MQEFTQENRIEQLQLVAEEAYRRLDARDGHGILALATGVGKTKIGIEQLIRTGAQNVLWMVPTETLRDVDVPKEFEKWGYSQYFQDCVTTICYASVPKIKGQDYDYIVMDEAHRITDLKYKFFLNNKISKILCLTATVPHEMEKRHLLHHLLKLPIVMEITPDDAMDKGLIAPFEIYCVGCKLSQEQEVNSKGKRTSERAVYNYWNRQCEDYRARRVSIPKQVAFARMRAIHNAKSKIIKAGKFLKTLDDDTRVITFSSTIKNAELLGNNTFHSKTTSDDYLNFNNKVINKISVVRAVDEGVNLTDVDMAIITQVNSSKRNFVQRLGRVVRFREDHVAKAYIFYFQDTVDEKWVKKSVEGFNPKRIHWIEYEKLNLSPIK